VVKEKLYCGGRWTKARFNSFIKSLIRGGTKRWGPISDVKRASSTRRGFYACSGYRTTSHEVPASIKIDGKRVNNVFVDHVVPIIDPVEGFTSWDSVIERMFCEADNLQVLCYECHKLKTQEERERRTNVTNE